MSLPEHIQKVLRENDMPVDSVYKHNQSGQYLVKHWALEQIGNNLGITFEKPEVLHLDASSKECVLLITGINKKEQHWSIGESAPYNTKINYPYSMAEARGKDRVVLKFLNFKEHISSEFEKIESNVTPEIIDTESLTYTPGDNHE